MATRVVDASILVAIVAGEPSEIECQREISGHRLVAPRLGRLEVAIALARKARLGLCSGDQARESFAALDTLSILWVDMDDISIANAFSLSLEIGHEVADCVYLSIARDMKFEIVTRDRKLAAAAGRCGVRVFAPGIM